VSRTARLPSAELDLSDLTAEQLSDLKQAAIEADGDRIVHLVDQIRDQNPALATAFADAVENFDYDQFSAQFRKSEANHERSPCARQPSDILIVDDTPVNLRLLSQILSEHGYKARAVLDGPHALTAAQTAPPDLILLDVRMPNMDGYEYVNISRPTSARAISPSCLSALSETDDKVKAFNAGGVDYITSHSRRKRCWLASPLT